jgi:hypothetical protein
MNLSFVHGRHHGRREIRNYADLSNKWLTEQGRNHARSGFERERFQSVNNVMHFPRFAHPVKRSAGKYAWGNRNWLRGSSRGEADLFGQFFGKNDKDLFDEAAAMRYKAAKVCHIFDVGSPSRANS